MNYVSKLCYCQLNFQSSGLNNIFFKKLLHTDVQNNFQAVVGSLPGGLGFSPPIQSQKYRSVISFFKDFSLPKQSQTLDPFYKTDLDFMVVLEEETPFYSRVNLDL